MYVSPEEEAAILKLYYTPDDEHVDNLKIKIEMVGCFLIADDENKYVCNFCNDLYPTTIDLNKHLKTCNARKDRYVDKEVVLALQEQIEELKKELSEKTIQKLDKNKKAHKHAEKKIEKANLLAELCT